MKIDERTGKMTIENGVGSTFEIPLIGSWADSFLERFINLRRQQREVNFRMDMAQFERVNGRAIANRDTQEKN